MRTWKWMITASLLVTLSAMGQDTTPPASSSAETTTSPASAQSPAAAPQSAPQPATIMAAPSPVAPAISTAAPTTMDQVVDRALAREHALITFLQTRTPLVETYLQNLKLDPQMGPSPREDHYFFGRLDP